MLNSPKHHSIFGVLPLVFLLSMGSGRLLSQDQSPEEYLRIAGEAEKLENFAGAEKIYLEAASKYPNQPEIFKRLGIIYQTELKFNESIETFQKVLEGAPQYPEVNFYLGMSYFGLNRFEEATKAFNKELDANPKYRRARYYKAMALQSLGRTSEAIDQFDVLLNEEPNDADVLFRLARLHKAASLQALNQLSRVDPDSDLLHVLKAESYVESEKYPEAIKEYSEILQ